MLPRTSSGTMCSRTAWWWPGLAWAFYCNCLMFFFFFCVCCSSICNSDILWCKMSTIPVLITASQKVDTCRDHLQDQLWLWIQSFFRCLLRNFAISFHEDFLYLTRWLWGSTSSLVVDGRVLGSGWIMLGTWLGHQSCKVGLRNQQLSAIVSGIPWY